MSHAFAVPNERRREDKQHGRAPQQQQQSNPSEKIVFIKKTVCWNLQVGGENTFETPSIGGPTVSIH